MLIINPLQESSYAFPVLEGVHLIGIVCGVGTAALLNFRLLGVEVTKSSPATLWNETALITISGLSVATFSGLLLFSVDPELYFHNQAFRFKMGTLLAAVLFYYTLVRRAAARDRKASAIAAISLTLYALVPLGGILIGYE
jgi:hypothetical protein